MIYLSCNIQRKKDMHYCSLVKRKLDVMSLSFFNREYNLEVTNTTRVDWTFSLHLTYHVTFIFQQRIHFEVINTTRVVLTFSLHLTSSISCVSIYNSKEIKKDTYSFTSIPLHYLMLPAMLLSSICKSPKFVCTSFTVN